MQEFLKSLEAKPPASLDPGKFNIDHLGKFNQLQTISTSVFFQSFYSKCSKALRLYSPVPDPRPKLLNFSPLEENSLTKELITANSYSKSNYLCGKELLYKVFNTENKLVRSIVENAGFKYTEAHDWNVLWIGKSAKPYLYDDLNAFQRINHFPNTFEITRKDKMCLNLKTMKEKFPNDYDFFPDTFIIPQDIGDFTLRFYNEPGLWIVKPCNSSQGKGIFILDSLNSLDLDGGCIVSRYIENPLLVNNLKSDLRIYVLVTSFEPLKIYIYQEGLARFACEDYNSANSTNKYVYLTNYSINKKNEKFVQNTDWQEDNIGHKWSFSAFIKELAKQGHDTDLVSKRIYDLIVKTIISIESLVVESIRKLALKHNNCFDLLGFDIMLDSDLKPWLLEVNLSPSMNTDSPLDLYIKSNLVSDALNLVGVRAFDRRKESNSKIKSRIKAKQNLSKTKLNPKKPESRKIDDSKYRSLFLETLEETLRMGRFNRIYPFNGSDSYEIFFKSPRKVNRALYNFLFIEILKSETIFPGISPNINEMDLINEYLSRVVRSFKVLGEKASLDIGIRMDTLADFLFPGSESGLVRIQKYLSASSPSKLKAEKLSLMKTFSSGQLENMIKSMEKEIVRYLFAKDSSILTLVQNNGEVKDLKPKNFKFLKLKTP
jgi:hypothetical protein